MRLLTVDKQVEVCAHLVEGCADPCVAPAVLRSSFVSVAAGWRGKAQHPLRTRMHGPARNARGDARTHGHGN